MEYRYGMRLRGFSPGCQPKEGLLRREDDASGEYYGILVYDRQLTQDEIRNYELESLSPNEAFDAVCDYEGLINYGDTIRRWIKNIYGIDLNQISEERSK